MRKYLDIKPLDMSGILDYSFRAFGECAKPLLIVYMLLQLPGTLALTVFGTMVQMEALNSAPANPTDPFAQFAPFNNLDLDSLAVYGTLLVIGGLISGLVLYPLAGGAGTLIISRAYHGVELSWQGAVKLSLKFWGRIVLCFILMTLLFIGILIPVMVLFIATVAAGFEGPGIALAVATGLVGIVTAVVYIYVTFSIVIAIQALVVEDISAVDALKRSWRLMNGYRLKYLMLSIVVGIAGAMLGAIGAIAGLLAPGLYLDAIWSSVSGTVISAFGAVILVTVYFSARAEHENYGITSRADSLVERLESSMEGEEAHAPQSPFIDPYDRGGR